MRSREALSHIGGDKLFLTCIIGAKENHLLVPNYSLQIWKLDISMSELPKIFGELSL